VWLLPVVDSDWKSDLSTESYSIDSIPLIKIGADRTPVERTLSASSSLEYKGLIDALRSNIGVIIEDWSSASARATYARGTEFDIPQQERVDRLREFLEAILDRSEDSSDKNALLRLRCSIRSEYARSLNLSTLIKRQSLLRDVMYKIVIKELPNMPKATAKLAVDGIVDKSIETTVVILEEYTDLQSSLTKWLLSGAGEDAPLEQSLARFCRNAMDYFDVDFVAVFRYDSYASELVCQACSAKSVSLSKDTRIQLKTMPAAVEAFESDHTMVLDDTGKSQKKRKIVSQVSFPHTVLVPISRGGAKYGMIVFGDGSRPVMFTPDEVGMAEELAKLMVRVQDNYDNFQKLSLRTRAQKALIETAALLQQEIESEEIYRIVATRLTELVPSQEVAFYVYDWRRRMGNPVYASGPYAAEIMADRDFDADVGIAGYVAKTRKAEIVLDTESDPRGALIPGTPKTRTRMLAVPVLGKKEVLGVIELLRYPPDGYSQEDLEIATMFANHASVALENAKLFNEVVTVRDQIEVSMDLLTHDIANYTTPINAYFSELSNLGNLDPKVANAIAKSERQVESITRLVEMVRTLAKLRTTDAKVFTVMDMRKAIDASISLVRSRTMSKDIEFDMFFPSEEMLVLADDMLEEIFTNLFYSVAMSDRQEKTILTVTGEIKKDSTTEYWWVMVAQPNRAIPDNLKGEVLRMAKASKSELTGGFGIGLAAARSIVNRYAGGMWVSDIVPGDYSKGCVFNIMIPRAH
jgi:GAF domain-containing protein